MDAVLARGRQAAEARMTSRCAVRRKTGRIQQNETTGREDPVWDDVYTDLRCRLGSQAGSASPSRTLDVAGVEMQVGVRILSLPIGADLVADGDLVEITAGEHTGTVWRIGESNGADQKTAQRLPVIGADRPREWAQR